MTYISSLHEGNGTSPCKSLWDNGDPAEGGSGGGEVENELAMEGTSGICEIFEIDPTWRV